MKNPFKSIQIKIRNTYERFISKFKRKPEVELKTIITRHCAICNKPFTKGVAHLEDELICHKECQPTKSQMKLQNLPINMLINEYNLIREKKSILSKSKRKVVVERINTLIDKGDIKTHAPNDKK